MIERFKIDIEDANLDTTIKTLLVRWIKKRDELDVRAGMAFGIKHHMLAGRALGLDEAIRDAWNLIHDYAETQPTEPSPLS